MELIGWVFSIFSIRLIGIAAGGLQSDNLPVQQEIFSNPQDHPNQKWEKVDQAVDSITQRFGHHFVVRGSLVGSREKNNTLQAGLNK